MLKTCFLVLMTCFISISGFAAAAGNSSAIDVVDMIIWEHQNWESNGGYKRLTLWRNGRSEVEVVPSAHIAGVPTDLLPKKGWTAVRQEHQIRFVRKDIYPREVARAKLQQAVEAGIDHLETFRPRYHDGSGTRVVIQINNAQKEIIIPMFMDEDKGTANYKRFIAVSKVLGGFDADAFETIIK
jgi:hypothetical protein